MNHITKLVSDMAAAVKPDTLTSAWQKAQWVPTSMMPRMYCWMPMPGLTHTVRRRPSLS